MNIPPLQLFEPTAWKKVGIFGLQMLQSFIMIHADKLKGAVYTDHWTVLIIIIIHSREVMWTLILCFVSIHFLSWKKNVALLKIHHTTFVSSVCVFCTWRKWRFTTCTMETYRVGAESWYMILTITLLLTMEALHSEQRGKEEVHFCGRCSTWDSNQVFGLEMLSCSKC